MLIRALLLSAGGRTDGHVELASPGSYYWEKRFFFSEWNVPEAVFRAAVTLLSFWREGSEEGDFDGL